MDTTPIEPAQHRSLQAERLDPRSLDDACLVAWRTLADRAIEPNPFYRPEYILADVLERSIEASLLVVRDGTRWVGCLPVRDCAPSRTLPLAHLEAYADEYAVCTTPLLDRDCVDPAIDALLEYVHADRHAAALLFRSLPSMGPAADALRSGAARRHMRPTIYEAYERAAWFRRPNGIAPSPVINESERRKLARRARAMSAELGGGLEIVDRASQPEAWDTFLAIERSGWKGEQGTALASVEADAAFFRRMCAGMSGAGRLELVALEVGGRTVAMECHLVDAEAQYTIKIAYDAEFGRFSPGVQLGYRVLEDLPARPFAMADSCADRTNAHINELWPGRRPMQTLLLPAGGVTSALVRPVVAGKTLARHVRDDLLHRPPG